MGFYRAVLLASAYLTILHTASTAGMVTGLGFQGMQENCILSFVVPRDKMKSSCDLDDKVKRRLNAMEMKVNVYKQQVAELQAQLDKERQHTASKMDALEKQVRDGSVNADTSFLLERRLALLEKEFERLSSKVTTGTSSRTLGEEKLSANLVYNTVDNNPATMPNLVRSMVQSEVKTQMENFTNKFESYVKEQILVYNHVFNMLPRRTDLSHKSGQTSPDVGYQKYPSDFGAESRSKTPSSSSILEEFQKVKTKLDHTGDKIAKHMGSILRNFTNPASDTSNTKNTHLKVNDTLEFDELGNTSELLLSGEGNDTNDSFSGENADSNDTVTKEALTKAVDEVMSSASSRISSASEKGVNSSETHSRHGESEGREENKVRKAWKENMIQDQNYKHQSELEERLKQEITHMLYTPLAEVISLVEKQAAVMEARFAQQEERTDTLEKELSSQIKDLDHNIQAINLQLESLSQGLQNTFTKLDKVKALEILINEVKKNMSSSALRISSHEMDEQGKKLKKLERLMGVYQQSMEHYRNETKHEYRELRDLVTKDTSSTKKQWRSLQENVTRTVSTNLDRMNHSYSEKLRDIHEQIRSRDDNVVVLQIDLSTFERKLNSKTSKAERQIDDMKKTVEQLTNRNRDLKRKYENLDQTLTSMSEVVNMTNKEMSDLKTEVKLSVLDDWLPMTFDYDGSRTGCHGDQYVKKSRYKHGKFIGAVLCSPKRYKIFLSNSLKTPFLNVGDESGMGEDHCEFVGATDATKIKLSPFKPSFGTVQGFARSHWGQEPRPAFLNSIKPSPHWYECGVRIP